MRHKAELPSFKQVKSLYRPKITRLYNLHKPRAFKREEVRMGGPR